MVAIHSLYHWIPTSSHQLVETSGSELTYNYGAEYQTHTDSNSYLHGCYDHDVPCAVCHVSNRTAVYMVPANYTCPTGWTREYYGYLMSERTFSTHHHSQFTCVDTAIKPVVGSANQDGLLFFWKMWITSLSSI